MVKELSKPSDRGRSSPEPGPPPGNRAEQRGTQEQLEQHQGEGPDEPLGWQWSEQERLPPRGEGSQQNQGEDKDSAPSVSERRMDPERAEGPVASGAMAPGLQSGGTRGPSNENQG